MRKKPVARKKSATAVAPSYTDLVVRMPIDLLVVYKRIADYSGESLETVMRVAVATQLVAQQSKARGGQS